VAKSALDKFKDQVTVASSTPAKPAKPASSGMIDLNTASEEELNALPGIGSVKAKAIVEGRPYASLADFESRGIVAKSALDKFKDQVMVSATAAKTKTTNAAIQAAPAGIIDLNTATAAELNALPGIGDVKAKAIIEGRPYASLSDFESRGIIAKSTFDKLRDQVTVAAAPSKAKAAAADAADEANPPEPMGKIDLNTATADELEALPGIGPVKAKAIVDGRPYASMADFEAKGIIAKSTFDKLRDAVEIVPMSGSAKATTEAGQGTPGQIAARKRIKMCGAQWRAAKADNKIPAGMTWPQFWSRCNTALKSRGY
jgi:competence protein ComEA